MTSLGLSSNQKLCFTEASESIVSKNEPSVPSSPLNITVCSKLFGHDLVHGCHQSVFSNLTRTSITMREGFVLTFLRRPILKSRSEICESVAFGRNSARDQALSLFSFLKLDRIHCEVCAMLRIPDCTHCFEQLYVHRHA